MKTIKYMVISILLFAHPPASSFADDSNSPAMNQNVSINNIFATQDLSTGQHHGIRKNLLVVTSEDIIRTDQEDNAWLSGADASHDGTAYRRDIADPVRENTAGSTGYEDTVAYADDDC